VNLDLVNQLTAEFFSVEVTLSLWIPRTYHISTSGGFEASNLTQVPLQSSCTHLRLKPHPLSNELAIVTALGQWSPLQSEKITSLPEVEALHGLFSKPVCAQEERMAHLGLTKGFLQLSPEAAMLPAPRVETRPPPPVPPFLLVQNLSPKDIAGSDITS